MTAAPIEIWANGNFKLGATAESVTAHLERLFPTASPEQRARFLAGRPFRVTTVADQAAADRVTAALSVAGIIAIQRSTTAAAPAAVVQPARPAATTAPPAVSNPPPRPTPPPPATHAAATPTPPAATQQPRPTSPPTALVSTANPAPRRSAYAGSSSTDKATPDSPLSRLTHFFFSGGANWKQALAVMAVGYVLMASGQTSHGPFRTLLGLILLFWGLIMLIRRRAPLPDGFQEVLDRVAKETGDSQLWASTKKEMHHLPAILAANEQLLAFTSGLMGGNSWLIALTDRRVIFLDKGLLYGLKQVTIDLDKVNAVSGTTGLVFGKIFIEDNASQRQIKNVPRGSVLKFTNKVNDAIEARKSLTQGGTVRSLDTSSQLSQLAALHEKGLLTTDEFNQQKAKLLAGL